MSCIFQAIWTRFFPVSLEVRRLLSQGEVGEVQMVRADLAAPLTHISRLTEKKLGGGALLDLGVYCLQFAFMVFNGERPESIQATGHCIDTGDYQKEIHLLSRHEVTVQSLMKCSHPEVSDIYSYIQTV